MSKYFEKWIFNKNIIKNYFKIDKAEFSNIISFACYSYQLKIK